MAKRAAIFPVISKRPAMHKFKGKRALAHWLKMSKARARLDRTPKRTLNPMRVPRTIGRVDEALGYDVILRVYEWKYRHDTLQDISSSKQDILASVVDDTARGKETSSSLVQGCMRACYTLSLTYESPLLPRCCPVQEIDMLYWLSSQLIIYLWLETFFHSSFCNRKATIDMILDIRTESVVNKTEIFLMEANSGLTKFPYFTSAYTSNASCTCPNRPPCQPLNSSHSLLGKAARIRRSHPPTMMSA